MKFSKRVLMAAATVVAAVVSGAVAAGIYGGVRYAHVPVEERDVFFDIGLVFLLGFVTVLVVAILSYGLRVRRRKAIGDSAEN